MKLAAIDIGTNSTRLLISELQIASKRETIFLPVIREMKITRLGKDLDITKIISQTGAQNTIKVLSDYLDQIKNHKVEKYRAVGTKVLRKADNSNWFTDLVEKLTGLKVEIISSNMEAMLSFKGAIGTMYPKKKTTFQEHGQILRENKKPGKKFGRKHAKHKDDLKDMLVIDIGGGSTEFITGNQTGEISIIESAEIGSVNISEKFLGCDVPDLQTIQKMNQFIEKELTVILERIRAEGFVKIIGLAGTISSVASVDMGLEKYEMARINGYVLKLKNIVKIQKKFCTVNNKNRQKIKGLDPERADIIIGGTAILIKIMEILQAEELSVSENDILDGIIYSLI